MKKKINKMSVVAVSLNLAPGGDLWKHPIPSAPYSSVDWTIKKISK